MLNFKVGSEWMTSVVSFVIVDCDDVDVFKDIVLI